MLAGHFAVALAGKRAAPAISLGTLLLATMLADILWTIFWMAGIERVEFKPGRGAANYIASADLSWSHSLVMLAVWAFMFAAIHVVARRDRRVFWILVIAVLSHWVLDLVSLSVPIAPGLSTRPGLWLWRSVPATVAIEGALWLAAVVLYTRATRPGRRAGSYVFWIAVPILTLAWFNNITGSPPRDARTAPVASFIFFSLAIGWAYLVDRWRPASAHAR